MVSIGFTPGMVCLPGDFGVPSSEPQILRPQVQDLLPYGFAVHHAGLPRADRKLVEETSVLLGS